MTYCVKKPPWIVFYAFKKKLSDILYDVNKKNKLFFSCLFAREYSIILTMKTTTSIKLDAEMQKNIADHARLMGREKQDVIREALSIGLQVLRMPEYYTARLNGMKFETITSEVRAALKKS